ncbi:hypothetical protein CUZ56_00587 [Saezia sanguinis]|uniref:Helicase/UvrB N-terminal domain-containing protein n=1 Tax=Saezia sanguinis TaxID=1965230 RepID=A0A433SHA5_9BURK|nr:DEAD/DEAH box helicase family protein [Saezia sanguinis]RUS68102.1 hypothetical protein CUZ56_00587 [Saezia sanguinis]
MALNNTDLKNYQVQLLEGYEAYLRRVRELRSPAAAFTESTEAFFGRGLPYQPLPGAEMVPYVCLRVPTGGGKTRLAGQSIKRVNEAFLARECSLVLWLVPSETIREQTLQALRTPGELLYQDMRDLFGSVHVLDINEALYLSPATLSTANTIIVATMQSFKRDSADGLRVYRQNGALMPHFDGIAPERCGEHSLVDVIRLQQPFIIVDEAHNQGTPLAVDTLVRLNPSCILELTATPDRSSQPSNILRSVSAATLQAEEMIKLPLDLAIHPQWQRCFAGAHAKLQQLEKDAIGEQKQTGEIVAPIVMLIQAERKMQGKETFIPEIVKKALIEDFHIPESKIAIATGVTDELTGKKLGDKDYPQYIITVDKLREGWDCPNAYVLFSFRNTTSATAVEQLLGRILRMPHVTRKHNEALNKSYAFVVSENMLETANNLRDGLVQSGFERLESKDLIAPVQDDSPTPDLFNQAQDITVNLPEIDNQVITPDLDALNALPKTLREKVDISQETGTLTVNGTVTASQVKQLAETFKKPEVIKAIKEQLDTALIKQTSPELPEKTPAERGEVAYIPLLTVQQGSQVELFEENSLLEGDWEMDEFSLQLTEAEFHRDPDSFRRALLRLSKVETIEFDPYDSLDTNLSLFGKEGGWSATDIVGWLDQKILFPYASQGQKVAWINAVVTYLLESRRFEVDELAYQKFSLRSAVERKMQTGLVQAKQRIFNELLDDDAAFNASDEHHIVFKQGYYAYDTPYTGPMKLKRHFFPVIGNLKNQGEELECAAFIANELEGVQWWVRNVERKKTSFWLQTASDKFYPDFIVRMQDGCTLVIEYKGAHIADNRDSQEKRRIGELWARRSHGTCRFVWVENKDWQTIEDAIV